MHACHVGFAHDHAAIVVCVRWRGFWLVVVWQCLRPIRNVVAVVAVMFAAFHETVCVFAARWFQCVAVVLVGFAVVFRVAEWFLRSVLNYFLRLANVKLGAVI